MTKILNSKPIIALIVSFVFLPATTFAAVLYLEPSAGEYHQGDAFMVDIRVDTTEECINAVEAYLSFSPQALEAVDFSQGSSMLAVWLTSPKINQEEGTISFSGGIPGGYCGVLPGDPGKSNLLGRVAFRAKKTNQARVAAVKFSDDSQVLLHDGAGTLADLVLRGAEFTILSGVSKEPISEWQAELEKDDIFPESFKVEINRDPSIFDGQYFITFNTTDKQTGIDYYEVKEGRGEWRRAVSPYLLEDQSLKGIIKVKAVDKAGNERIAEYGAKKPLPYWIVIVVVIIGGIIWWIKRKSRIKNEKF